MRFISAVVGLLFGFIVVGSAQQVAAQSDGYSAWIAACLEFPAKCASACQGSESVAMNCASQIYGYLMTPRGAFPRFQTWSYYPGSEPAHVNNSTPMHGTYLSIFVNDIALNYIVKKLRIQPERSKPSISRTDQSSRS